MRIRAAFILNLLVPGSGLIVLRREWLGLAITVLFVVFAQIGLVGTWLLPESLPDLVTLGGWAAAGLVWAGAQWLLWLRRREVAGHGVATELESLCARSAAAVEARDYAGAHDILMVALTLNDEHPEVIRQWAQLMTLMGRFRQARKAWHRLRRMATGDDDRLAAREALTAIPRE